MTYFNKHHDSISTVQLSPFGEDQWHRIVTYSPIYVHWTDMLMMSHQRPTRTISGKLNSIDPIDMNRLKLDDEILLHELHDIKKAAAIPPLTTLNGKNTSHESKVFDSEQDKRTPSPTEDYQVSSSFFHEIKEPMKQHNSYVEPSFTYHTKRPVTSNQTITMQINSINPVKKTPDLSLGPKPQSALSVQLRQSAIAREHALSARNDHRSASPLSIASSKRTAGSAHSIHRHHQQQQQQQYRTPYTQTPSQGNEARAATSLHERLNGESSSSFRKLRARSTNSSRSTMHMLKTRNDRSRQKQNIELKTLLVEPWKQPAWSDGTLEESIPNSLEIMHKMCGPATPFERNLRNNYHRQLYHYRIGSMKC